MGDYKLKMSGNYVVSEADRVDADKKRKQLLMLKKSVFNLKEQFNQQVLALRDKKKALVDFITRSAAQLSAIRAELRDLGIATDYEDWVPLMDADAYPEKRYEVTPEDVEKFERDEAMKAELARAEDSDMMGGFGGGGGGAGGGGGGGGGKPVVSAQVQANNSKESGTVQAAAGEAPRPSSTSSALGRQEADNRGPPSKVEAMRRDARIRVIEFKKSRIEKFVNDCVKEFDESVRVLEKERVALDG
ncbi:Cilia- and flagella-associated protein 44, partial [Cladochytrium tenue]